MSPRRARPPAARLRLGASLSVLALATAAPAWAQAPEPPQAPQPVQSPAPAPVQAPSPAQPAAPDAPATSAAPAVAPVAPAPGATSEENRPEYGALGPEGVYLEANELIRNEGADTVTARGSVEARYQGRTIRADELVYERATGRAVARGNVVIVNADGTSQFAQEAELDDQFRAGIAVGFSARLDQNIKIAAARAVRRSEDVQELDQAIYTPCNVCVENGEATAPTFSLEAERVTQDRRRRIVVYRNAVLRVRGVPVLATPYFAHPDPTADRASGLLVPRIRLSDRRGLSYEQPYLWVISPSADLVISPQINTKVNPFLNLQYRQRFYSGDIDIRVGGTYDEDFDGQGRRFGDASARSYILARGDFDWDENWSYGFAAERVSDDTLFDRYNIREVFTRRGLYQPDSRRLLSQAYAIRQDARSYLSIAAMSFQGLRPTDDDGTFPTVAPLIEGRWEPNVDIFGGRLLLQGDAVLLERSVGVDSRRASVSADWRSSAVLANGMRFDPFAYLRGDLYGVNDFAGRGEDGVGRAAGSVGVDVSWPFVRVTGTSTIILEPQVQIAANAETDVDDRVPNEDSRVFAFDETNIFRFNRFPGWDRFEEGLIATAGGRASWRTTDNRSASVFVGRSYRSRQEPEFALRSGLRDRASAWVVQAEATPVAGVTTFVRALVDDDGGTPYREVGLNLYSARAQGYFRYYYDESPMDGVDREDVIAFGRLLVTRNWGVTGGAVYDVANSVARFSSIGLLYVDECVTLEIVYERENTINRAIGPNDSVSVRLTLATFGDVGYRQYDYR